LSTFHTYNASTLSELHTAMCLDLSYAPLSELDTASVIDVSKHNVLATADSLEWDFDLKSLWLSKSRWSMMVNQYLDSGDVQSWLAQCMKIGSKDRGQATLRTKTVKSQGGAANGFTNKERRRWGSCMLAVVYKAVPTPTITLHSRTSYLGYLSALDVSVAQKLGQYVADLVGLPIDQMGFVWQIDSIQYHSFKSLAFLLCNADPEIRRQGRRVMLSPRTSLTDEELTLADAPAMKGSRLWLNKVRREDRDNITYGQMNYNTYRRIRRRWHTEVLGYDYATKFEGPKILRDGTEGAEFFTAYRPLPNCYVRDLDLSKLGLPRARLLDIMDGVKVDIDTDDDEEDDE
jgi:hypothetical protein